MNPLSAIRRCNRYGSVSARALLMFLASWMGTGVAAQPERIAFGDIAYDGTTFIANADGTAERLLPAPDGYNYNATWSRDGQWIAFTSERGAGAELYRTHPDGTELQRLTSEPAYDDQASFSPDGRRLVFVSTRAKGDADLWILDIETRKAKSLTSGKGGDFRPSWSPDGRWIAFSSDRGSGAPRPGKGRWELLHLTDIYLIRPDGSGLRQVTREGYCGSPRWSDDSAQLVVYCADAEDTLGNRLGKGTSRLAVVDVRDGTLSNRDAGAGLKFSPAFLPSGELAFIRTNPAVAGASGIVYANGRTGPAGVLVNAAWSPDGRQVVYTRRQVPPGRAAKKRFSRDPAYDLAQGQLQWSFNQTGDHYLGVMPPAAGAGFGIAVVDSVTKDSREVFRKQGVNAIGAQWSPDGSAILFGIGAFTIFADEFNTRTAGAADRGPDGGAQLAMIDSDGSNYRELTTGANSNAFPAFAPDGTRVVYRTFGPEGSGLRLKDLRSGATTVLTTDYDNFPHWSPRGDLITFTRRVQGDYEIFTIRPDGTGTRRLTRTPGPDSHSAFSPDGTRIAFSTARMGFKDEVVYTPAGPQPYGELFVMRSDGTDVRQLTDDQWEQGMPNWQPSNPSPAENASTLQSSATR